MKNYWKNSPDAEIDTTKNILRYWKEAAKLQISMPYWTENDGNQKPGKTVTINLDALREADGGVALLEKIVADITA